MSDFEIESFKRRIDLVKYAQSLGYRIEKKTSWRGETVMRTPGDKIIIRKREANGHFIYWSPHDPKDCGSIIEFVQKRLALSLGNLRKELRQWV
jgi:hypothetical protein